MQIGTLETTRLMKTSGCTLGVAIALFLAGAAAGGHAYLWVCLVGVGAGIVFGLCASMAVYRNDPGPGSGVLTAIMVCATLAIGGYLLLMLLMFYPNAAGISSYNGQVVVVTRQFAISKTITSYHRPGTLFWCGERLYFWG